MPLPPEPFDDRPLILASGSPWRRALLAEVGVVCEALESGVHEGSIAPADPSRRARERALAKARAVAADRPRAVVIGADQVAQQDDEVFGKPLDDEDHLRRLKAMRGREHVLITAVCLLMDGQERVFEERTRLKVRADLSDAELEAYVASGEGRGCAAGYRAEGLGAQLIERIEGDWFNVIGLPVHRLIGALRELGWRPDALRGRSP